MTIYKNNWKKEIYIGGNLVKKGDVFDDKDVKVSKKWVDGMVEKGFLEEEKPKSKTNKTETSIDYKEETETSKEEKPKSKGK